MLNKIEDNYGSSGLNIISGGKLYKAAWTKLNSSDC